MFSGIQHVAVTVDDLDAARRFYGDALGLRQLDRPDFPVPGLWYEVAPGQAIHLVVLPDHDAPKANHFALEVEDLDDVVARLEGAGVVARVGAVVEGAGRQAALRDPAGNRIELNQPA